MCQADPGRKGQLLKELQIAIHFSIVTGLGNGECQISKRRQREARTLGNAAAVGATADDAAGAGPEGRQRN